MRKKVWTFYLLLLCYIPWPVVIFIILPIANSRYHIIGNPALQEYAVQLDYWLPVVGRSFFLLSFLALLLMLLLRKIASPSWGSASLLFLLAAVLWGFAIPPSGKAYEQNSRISCYCNLRQIYLSLQQYAEDNQGNFPPELQTLVKSEYLTDPGVYRCPSDWKDNGFTNYLYSGAGRKLTEKPPFVLLEDIPDNHPGTFRNRLYSDGKIENCYPGVAAK